MNHVAKIASKLPEYGLDAMLITSESGERYALGFHGEGLLLITREGAHYTTDAGDVLRGSVRTEHGLLIANNDGLRAEGEPDHRASDTALYV